MEVRKKPRENVSSLMRRFTQKVRESGILVSAKKSQFHSKKKSKNLRRKDALQRVRQRKIRQRLRRTGSI